MERGRVRIPADFFNRTAKREYVFWPRALLREFLQNSVDAGSNTIKFSFNKEKLILGVSDDGCGMTKDTILNKLLVLGGTEKPEGSIGGFGKAKEVLFFAWKYYLIKTGNLIVQGKGPDFIIKKSEKFYPGTQCIIKFYSEHEYSSVLSAAEEYLPRNEITAAVFLNGIRIRYFWGDKTLIKEFDWGNVFTCRSSGDDVSIRVKGVEMYKHNTVTILKNKVVVELKGESYQVLTANRDSLNYTYSKELNDFLNDLSVDPLSTVLNFTNDIQELISGRHMLKIPESLQSLWRGDEGNKIVSVSLQNYNLFKSQDTHTNKSALRIGGYDYDFIIRRSPSYPEEDIKEFMDDPAASCLANLWTSIIFEVAIANQLPVGIIKVGFMFSNEIEGFCVGSKDCPIILINPISKKMLNADNTQQIIALMEDIAYHELSHITFKRHDERFVNCSEDYRVNHRIWKDVCFIPEKLIKEEN